jgi:hypothetical protein
LISFDPISSHLYLSQSGGISQTFRGLNNNDKYVTLNNGAPGLRYARILVNGTAFALNGLVNGQTVVVDISGALTAGGNNTVVVEGFGSAGAGADVSIGEIPGGPSGLQLSTLSGSVGSVINLPVPQITQQGTQVVISWPATGPAGEDFTLYQLQVSATGVPGSWSAEGAAPVLSGGQLSVTVPAGGTAQYYQLVNPTAQ